ncbi:MAG: UDP-N-acetylglucosamine 1-carboxyvinyltransferase [Lachnospiraceae bacterium]|nr:UDP-N-acetylglucosamine 1-carboxyvinyltransferase [Lachnospiraceae bacterium]MDY5648800.1 UDP-N-acetylglucosamine 1-carboxyvinyltransferase [Lachnospiraceae bacterium]
MVRYEIEGGRPLNGELTVQGSKNAVLPMMAAALLCRGSVVLHNCPRIDDVFCMIRILEHLGCTVNWEGHTVIIDAYEVRSEIVPAKEAKRMRSSVILLGALLGRRKKAVLSRPGGCVIGERPIDLHLSSLQKMGADIRQEEEYMYVKAPVLTGARIELAKSSVGATENILLAAVLAKGVTEIVNAAREPEIPELCRLLRAMGADIENRGNGYIRVRGVKELHDAELTVMSDRIVTGTYLLAAAAAGGEVTVLNPPWGQVQALLTVLSGMGLTVRETEEYIYVKRTDEYLGVDFLETRPYPGFPTDLQSPLLAVLLRAKGKSRIRETIFESRFRAAEEFPKLGARVSIDGAVCTVEGVPKLHGARLISHELRGGAALILAGLAADGRTMVEDKGFIRRGYERMEADLRKLGAGISVTDSTDDR